MQTSELYWFGIKKRNLDDDDDDIYHFEKADS